jgi:hypothetical protein
MHPPRPVGRETARGYDAVYVRVVQECLPPGVQDAQKAERGAEMLRRARDIQERRGTRLEEQVVHHSFVLQREPCESMGKGEDDMGVGEPD